MLWSLRSHLFKATGRRYQPWRNLLSKVRMQQPERFFDTLLFFFLCGRPNRQSNLFNDLYFLVLSIAAVPGNKCRWLVCSHLKRPNPSMKRMCSTRRPLPNSVWRLLASPRSLTEHSGVQQLLFLAAVVVGWSAPRRRRSKSGQQPWENPCVKKMQEVQGFCWPARLEVCMGCWSATQKLIHFVVKLCWPARVAVADQWLESC